MKTPAPRMPNRLLLFWAAWISLGMFSAMQWLGYQHQIGVPAWMIVLFAFTYNVIWAFFYPAIAGFTRFLNRRELKWPGHLLRQLPLALLFSAGHLLLYFGFYRLAETLWQYDYYKMALPLFFNRLFASSLVLYGQVALVTYLLEYRQLVRERERRSGELEKELARAQLRSLKMQLHPHFLFNTLNSIQALMDEDIGEAHRMVGRLSAFLRSTLANPGDRLLPLEQELEFIRNYLEIEGIRFRDRLTVNWEIDPATAGALLPNLLLQPLVENAVHHGIAPFARPGRIVIGSRRRVEMLELTVWNSGSAGSENPAFQNGTGVGLANVRNRLVHQYGDNQQFRCGRSDDGGYLAAIAIPFAVRAEGAEAT